MKNAIRTTLFVSLIFTFVTACNSASSDAKKVEVKKAPQKVEKVADTPAVTTQNKGAQKAPAPKSPEEKYVEGKHYVDIFPEMQTDSAPGKVEVVELMWLGCPHCYSLEPVMQAYKKNHPDFVEFKQVPAMLNPSWAKDGETYYLAEVLDPTGEKELVSKVFKSIHELKRRLRSPDAVKRFFIGEGYSEEQIENARKSMAFQAKIRRAQEISAASQAQSVPTIIINGKYRTSPYIAGNEENLMEIIDMLTKREKK